MGSFWAIVILSLICFFVLSLFEKLSPIVTAFCISGIFLGNVLCILFLIQISVNVVEPSIVLFVLLPINCIISSSRLIHSKIKRQIAFLRENKAEYKSKFITFIYRVLTKVSGWFIVPVILLIPVLAVLFIVLLLFGQTPDSVIKIFTSTSDWTFSQKVSPPPEVMQGHYLCTVAVSGDEKLVKPLRIGYRHGHKIIVNRQLCIANAFEDFIKEKLPNFHRAIRKFYDKHGYPLSKKINTKTKANITYILMKPLEWLFLIFLYTFDIKPENRIAVQYIKKV